MKRRSFLKGSIYASAAWGLTSGFGFSNAWAAPGARPRSVVNTMLLGGADLRHLFVPRPDTTPGSYGQVFWNAREDLYNGPPDPKAPDVPSPTIRSAQTIWENDYIHVTHRGKTFGIHNSAGWLKDQFVLGRVAIVCNVKPGTNQRHDHATLIMNTGDRMTQNFKVDVPGWGGKLAHAITQANVVSLTNSVSVFCNGINANRSDRVISAPNMRDVALAERSSGATEGKLSRSLMAYYARRGETLASTPYAKITAHEKALRAQGSKIDTALVGTTRSTEIQSLYKTYLGSQVGSLYDATLVGAYSESILNMRVASMEVSGWDTHDYQNFYLKTLFTELFGIGKAFDTLLTGSAAVPPGNGTISADASDNMVFTITSEFGRQLGANGTWGTDHGVGTYMIVFGKQVRGDVYGEMFPQAEIPLWVKYSNFITGLTAFERVLGEVCDWVAPGTANQLFPTRNTLEMEPNVDLRAMFAPAYKVSGTIRDSAGNPIPLAKIAISDSTGFVWNIKPNASGSYSLDPLVAGTYTIVCSEQRYDIPSSTFNIASADVVHNVVGTVYPGTVSGRIATPAGVPLVGYELWDITTHPESVTKTDANGNFKFIGIKIGGSVLINAYSGSAQYSLTASGPLMFVHSGGDVLVNFTATPLFPDADLDTVPNSTDNCTNVINPNQRDTNKDGFGNMCDADLNNDKRTDLKDKEIMKKAFTVYNPDADLSGDGVVNSKDWDTLLRLYGKVPGPSGLVP